MTNDSDIPVTSAEDEALIFALKATSDVLEEDIGPELNELIEADRRRVLYGMAAAARHLRHELDENARWLKMLADELARKDAVKMVHLDWLVERVREVAEPMLVGKAKHVDIPGIGRVKYQDHKRGVKIEDHEAFIEWAAEFGHTELYIETTTLKVNDAKAVAKVALLDSGQLLPGVEDVPEHRTSTFKIDD